MVLDSLAPGSDGGRLGDDQLGWLDGVLAGRPEVPAVVCLHHPPVAVGVPAADAIRLADADALAEVIGRHPHVVRVAAGHLHRAVTTASPARCSPWRRAPGCRRSLTMTDDEQIGLVDEPTAFLLHRVADGGCVTHTVQVSHAAGQTCWF